MIGILGGMGTQAGLDFCNKLAILYRGKIDQDYPLFLLYNKSNIPGRPESIGTHTSELSNKINNKKGAFDFFSKKNFKLVLFFKFNSNQKIIDIMIIAIVKCRDNL